MDTWMGGCRHGEMDGLKVGWMDGYMHACMGSSFDKWMMDGWMDGWVHVWMD